MGNDVLIVPYRLPPPHRRRPRRSRRRPRRPARGEKKRKKKPREGEIPSAKTLTAERSSGKRRLRRRATEQTRGASAACASYLDGGFMLLGGGHFSEFRVVYLGDARRLKRVTRPRQTALSLRDVHPPPSSLLSCTAVSARDFTLITRLVDWHHSHPISHHHFLSPSLSISRRSLSRFDRFLSSCPLNSPR